MNQPTALPLQNRAVNEHSPTRLAFFMIIGIFFMWGLSHGLLDVLNKHFQEALHVSRMQSAFAQTAYFGAYLIIAIPAGLLMERFGYKAGILLGLSLFALGALLFIPANLVSQYGMFLIALFVLACGLCCLETAANLFAAALGAPEKAAQRLTLGHSFNGLGIFLGPVIGGSVFFLPPFQLAGISIEPTAATYGVLAFVVILMIVVFLKVQIPDVRDSGSNASSRGRFSELFAHRHFTGALFAQFCYMICYAGVGAFFINYAIDHWDGVTPERAAYLLSVGLLTYMAGRFLGTWLMQYITPRRLLIVNCIICAALCLLAVIGIPVISVIGLVLSYLFSATFYPTIFAMGTRGLGALTKKAGSVLMMTLAGGAVGPLVMGLIADQISIAASFALPGICFLLIARYGWTQR